MTPALRILLSAALLAASTGASPTIPRNIKRDAFSLPPQTQTSRSSSNYYSLSSFLLLPLLALALVSVGGLVYRKLFSKKDQNHAITAAETPPTPPMPELHQISTTINGEADTDSIRSWVVHDMHNSEDDEEDARTSLSLARPVVAITSSSKYTRPSTIESPFSPTRKHVVYPESPQRSPKVKDFRVEVANVLLDWPRTNDKETPPQQQQHQQQQQQHQHQHQQQWRATEAAAPPCPANTHTHSNTYMHAGDTTRNAKSLDLKRPTTTTTLHNHHHHQHHHRRNHSTVTPVVKHSNTALGAMPCGLQKHLAHSEPDHILVPCDTDDTQVSAKRRQAAATPQQQQPTTTTQPTHTLPSITPIIYTAKVTTAPKLNVISQRVPTATTTTTSPQELANENLKYISSISLRKGSIESESSSSNSWYLNLKNKDDGELSPAPSSVFMEILEQNEEG
ncbi:hypothetical protein BJ741DRAFT_600114 [Chytriomyces cf. hyalinus JEL632]|nr:hypothetical protein BJ741DRAFT_600114 [Chytriomyces cf. hyalinus JEL632]